MKPIKMTIEYVEWVDAVARAEWMDDKDTFPVHACFSVGKLAEETKEHIALAGTWGSPSDGGGVNGIISIPKAWIKKRTTVTI